MRPRINSHAASRNRNQTLGSQRTQTKIVILRRRAGVDTKVLMQAVRRNIERFPNDFMFQLTEQEIKDLRSQIVTLNLATTR